MTKYVPDNSMAAGATLTIVSVFLLSCLLFVLIGYGVDKIIALSLNFQSIFPATQMRYDTVKILLMAFEFEPFIILIGAGINVWASSTRTTSGESDLSGIAGAAAEMILLTLGVIALTMFGGAAIESVIYTMNNIVQVASPEPGLYAAVIFIAPVFYGLCILGLFGAIIQYIISCVQVVDYSVPY